MEAAKLTAVVEEHDGEAYLVFPEQIMELLRVDEGASLDVTIENGQLIIKKVASSDIRPQN